MSAGLSMKLMKFERMKILLLLLCLFTTTLSLAASAQAQAQAQAQGRGQAPAQAKSAKAAPAAKVKPKAKTAPTRIAPAKKPARPLVGFVTRVEAAIQQGCADTREIRQQAAKIGIPHSEIENLMAALLVPAEQTERGCIPYALASSPSQLGSTLAVLERPDDNDRYWINVLHSKQKGSADTLRESLVADQWRDLLLPANDFSNGGSDALRVLPYNLQWEATLLARRMLVDTDAATRYQFRLVLQKQSGEDYEKIAAIELLNQADGRLLDSAVWLDRDHDVAGAYFNAKGNNYERMFWESPVDYLRITRGVGATTVTVKRRVAIPATGKKKKTFVNRSFHFRGNHIGIDFAIPVGEPVRAVADAVVVFTGVRGGYGNLIVLEHGKNYQTYYAHLSRFADGLSVGQKILRGEEIGYVGMTGKTTGPHLHFEIRRDHEYFDPLAKQNNMALWNLYPEEHARLLVKMMALNVTRAGPLPPAALGSAQK